MKRVLRCCLAAIGLTLFGCGGVETVTVSGTVNYAGQPVEMGEISFDPTDAHTSPDGAVIENGKFTAEVKLGEKIVRIRASRPIPAERRSNHDSPGLREDFIPAKYHKNSTVKVTIEAGAPQDLVYDLE